MVSSCFRFTTFGIDRSVFISPFFRPSRLDLIPHQHFYEEINGRMRNMGMGGGGGGGAGGGGAGSRGADGRVGSDGDIVVESNGSPSINTANSTPTFPTSAVQLPLPRAQKKGKKNNNNNNNNNSNTPLELSQESEPTVSYPLPSSPPPSFPPPPPPRHLSKFDSFGNVRNVTQNLASLKSAAPQSCRKAPASASSSGHPPPHLLPPPPPPLISIPPSPTNESSFDLKSPSVISSIVSPSPLISSSFFSSSSSSALCFSSSALCFSFDQPSASSSSTVVQRRKQEEFCDIDELSAMMISFSSTNSCDPSVAAVEAFASSKCCGISAPSTVTSVDAITCSQPKSKSSSHILSAQCKQSFQSQQHQQHQQQHQQKHPQPRRCNSSSAMVRRSSSSSSSSSSHRIPPSSTCCCHHRRQHETKPFDGCQVRANDSNQSQICHSSVSCTAAAAAAAPAAAAAAAPCCQGPFNSDTESPLAPRHGREFVANGNGIDSALCHNNNNNNNSALCHQRSTCNVWKPVVTRALASESRVLTSEPSSLCIVCSDFSNDLAADSIDTEYYMEPVSSGLGRVFGKRLADNEGTTSSPDPLRPEDILRCQEAAAVSLKVQQQLQQQVQHKKQDRPNSKGNFSLDSGHYSQYSESSESSRRSTLDRSGEEREYFVVEADGEGGCKVEGEEEESADNEKTVMADIEMARPTTKACSDVILADRSRRSIEARWPEEKYPEGSLEETKNNDDKLPHLSSSSSSFANLDYGCIFEASGLMNGLNDSAEKTDADNSKIDPSDDKDDVINEENPYFLYDDSSVGEEMKKCSASSSSPPKREEEMLESATINTNSGQTANVVRTNSFRVSQIQQQHRQRQQQQHFQRQQQQPRPQRPLLTSRTSTLSVISDIVADVSNHDQHQKQQQQQRQICAQTGQPVSRPSFFNPPCHSTMIQSSQHCNLQQQSQRQLQQQHHHQQQRLNSQTPPPLPSRAARPELTESAALHQLQGSRQRSRVTFADEVAFVASNVSSTSSSSSSSSSSVPPCLPERNGAFKVKLMAVRIPGGQRSNFREKMIPAMETATTTTRLGELNHLTSSGFHLDFNGSCGNRSEPIVS